MKIVAILQARFSSTRLPGKVLRQLGNRTVLAQIVTRVRQATRLDEVWVATSNHATDDPVNAEAINAGVPCYRGSLGDVLARYHGAAMAAKADLIVRVTCDCPLFDGHLLDRMLATFADETAQDNRIDYLSNVIERSFPRGLDAEIFTSAALDRAFREATRSYDREHVTPYFYNHPELFNLRSFVGKENLSRFRWTLDTPADWDLIKEIYAANAERGNEFTTEDVLELLTRRPELQLLNASVEQKQDHDAPGAH